MKLSELKKISDPDEVFRRFKKYKGSDDATIGISYRDDKKYMVRVNGERLIHFGSKMQDYTLHKNEERRKSYLARSGGIKGEWRDDKWSANQLSRSLLWM